MSGCRVDGCATVCFAIGRGEQSADRGNIDVGGKNRQ
jgi:hypothetical protein